MNTPNPYLGMFLAVLRVLAPPCATWLVAHHFLSAALMQQLEVAITPYVTPVILGMAGLAANSQWLHHKRLKAATDNSTTPPTN